MSIVLAFLIGVLSGVFSGLIGGASGTISVPLLLLLGLPPYAAVSTPKIGAVGIALGSYGKFYRTKHTQWALVPSLIFVSVAAAVLGASLLLKVPEGVVEKVIAAVLILSAVFLYSGKDVGVIGFSVSKIKKIFGYAFFFLAEGLRAALGSGIGMFTQIVLVNFFGLTMLEATATKRISGVVVSIVALGVFLFKGVVDIPVGVALFFGTIIGSYLGTHYAIKIGDKWIKYLFTMYAIIMAFVLIL